MTTESGFGGSSISGIGGVVDIPDGPGDYAGKGGQHVAVKIDETGLEYVDPAFMPGAAQKTTAAVEFWADGTSGDDLNDGESAGAPKKTLQAVFDKIADFVNHNVVIHLSGVFILSDTEIVTLGKVIPSDNVFGTILVTGGKANNTIVTGPHSADISSTQSIGLSTLTETVDAHAGYHIEILSGPAAGERRLCWSNDGTTFVPSSDFSVDPGAGASFQITHPSTEIRGPGSGSATLTIDPIGEGTINIQNLWLTGRLFIPMAGEVAFSGVVSDNDYTNPMGNRGDVTTWLGFINRSEDTSLAFDLADQLGFSHRKTGSLVFSASKVYSSFGNAYFASQIRCTSCPDVQLSGRFRKGIFLRDCRNLGVKTVANALASQITKIDGGTHGLEISGSSDVQLDPIDISGCTGDAINIKDAKVEIFGSLTGSGNGGAGLQAGPGAIVKTADGAPPTVTGTIGDISVDGVTQAKTWSEVDGGDPLVHDRAMILVSKSDSPTHPPTRTTGELHIYADGTSGDDANDGKTLATAVKTLTRAVNLIPENIAHNCAIHLSGTFEQGNSTTVVAKNFESATGLNIPLIIDGGSAVTVLAGPFTSDASSIASIGDSGQSWTPDAYRGRIVHVTSGPAAGNRRMIYSNDATTLVPHKNWTVDPGVGATFQIEEPATVLNSTTIGLLNFVSGGNGQIILSRLKITGGFFLRADASLAAVTLALNNGVILDGTNPFGVVQARGVNISSFEFLWDPDDFGFPDFTLSVMGASQINPASRISSLGGRFDLSGFIGEHIEYAGGRGSGWDLKAGSRVKKLTISGGAFLTPDSDPNLQNTSGYRTTKIDGSAGVGLSVESGSIDIAAGVEISGNASHGIEVGDGGLVRMLGAVVGTGNAGAGVYCKPGGKVATTGGAPPTLTGAIGDVSLDGITQAKTWIDIDGGDPAVNDRANSIVVKDGDDIVPNQTVSELHLYADGTIGDDGNDGLTASTPKKTLNAIFDLVPAIISHNVAVHLSGTFSDQNAFLNGRLFKQLATSTSPPRLVIDGGDSMTDVVASQASNINSAQSIGVTTAGWTVDAYAGYWVEITSGPIAGQRRMIQANNATTLTPVRDFSADPGVGATFRIARWATTVEASSSVSFFQIRGMSGLGVVDLQRLFFDGSLQFLQVGESNVASINISHVVCNLTNANAVSITKTGLTSVNASIYFKVNPATFALEAAATDSNGGLSVRSIKALVSEMLTTSASLQAGFFKELQVRSVTGLAVSRGNRCNKLVIDGCSGYSFESSGNIRSNSGYATTKIDKSTGVGVSIKDSELSLSDVAIENNASHGIDVRDSRLTFTGAASGSGNSGAGLLARPNSKVIIADGAPPTLTGTVGDITIDGTTQASTWAAIDAGTPIARGRDQILVSESDLGGNVDTDEAAIHDNVAGEIAAIAAKATPVGADLLLIEDSAATNAKKRIQISNLPNVDSGYSIQYGAKLDAVDRFALVNGDAVIGKLPSLDQRTEATVPIAGNLKQLSWNSATSDATTVIKIHKNAVVVQTKTLTGAKGSIALAGAVAAGDELAIEYDAGTAPDQSNWIIMIGA